MTYTLGVDIGGTKIAGGVVNEDGEIVAMTRKPTPALDPDSTAGTVVAVIEELRKSYDVEAIGIGCAGFVASDHRKIAFAPNLNWRNEPLADKVEAGVGLPVYLENDANAAAWGEYRYGAGRDHASAVAVTVGTGIGGGIIMDGHLISGSFGLAGEIGHLNMVPDGLQCGCGQLGCWEVYASGNALVRIAKQYALSQLEKGESSHILELAGGDIDAINGLMVTAAAAEGEAGAIDLFHQVGTWLGRGMADLSAILDPQMYIVAGGVSEAGNLLLDPTRAAFLKYLTAANSREVAPIVQAQLGNDAGMIGAADLARGLLA
ncbi:ROK family glucokinase [Arcanobacterium canis]|uniref:Glucokinase n=1 Tax=Arcanobacterium canis TaxID=999183 RepID=A0ABY8FXZ4_9ACTO|nr:ROK family glucokinase [Arcanobacterium canis]WFM83217.1 ROK family glucokinase [Arcanobacterium canis]